MKKIKNRLQLTTTTVRVLQAAELSAVNGGFAGTSANPTACAAGALRAGTSANPTACTSAADHRVGTSANPTACTSAGH